MAGIWLEAETFDELGGWIVDQQSMATLGSAYIMAHGIGIPVEDAKTGFDVTESGEYTVWARTRDWTAAWKRGTPGGIFNVIINDETLPTTLGTNGTKWDWQKAGTVSLKQGQNTIALHDLSGFNGRCDAVYLTSDKYEKPENDGEKLAEFRRKATNTVCEDCPEEYDLAVIGGGVAGICAAIAALRTGSKVILIHDRPVLGGCNSSEIRVGMGGFAHAEPYPNLGHVVTEIAPIYGGGGVYPAEAFEDARKQNIFLLNHKDNYKLAMNECVTSVEKDPEDPHKITAVVARNIRTGKETRYRAKLFADCTGDAVVSRMMGAETMYGRESRSDFGETLAPEKGDRMVMGMSVLWDSKTGNTRTEFPDIDWGVEFTEEKAYYVENGAWEWETGQFRDQADDAEYIRDYGMMTIYANWAYLKNHSNRKEEWANKSLEWVSPIGGKRESYRVVGDYIMTQKDVEDHVEHRDATGTMTWDIDLHFPDPDNLKNFDEPFRSCAYHRGIVEPYPVPYRCLYARDAKNLFLGGRHISMTHVAFACVRVMRTLGILGEVIGLAASVCRENNAYPRDIYEKHFDQLKELMKAGVPVPCYHAYQCRNSESYHFKDTGHIGAYPQASEKLKDPKLMKRIKALGVLHKNDCEGFEKE